MTEAIKNKWQMRAKPEECRVCLMCQLVCSLKQKRIFNPSDAYIKISNVVRPDGGLDVGISFNEDCDHCGLCARYCVYGALSREKVKEARANL